MAALIVLCLLMTGTCRALNPVHFRIYHHCYPGLATHIGISGHSCGLTEGGGKALHQMVFPTGAQCSAVGKSFFPLERLYKIDTEPALGSHAWILILAFTSRAQVSRPS